MYVVSLRHVNVSNTVLQKRQWESIYKLTEFFWFPFLIEGLGADVLKYACLGAQDPKAGK